MQHRSRHSDTPGADRHSGCRPSPDVRRSAFGAPPVALNFTDADQQTQFWSPSGGNYREALTGSDNLTSVVAGAPTSLKVPSNYGRVWLSA